MTYRGDVNSSSEEPADGRSVKWPSADRLIVSFLVVAAAVAALVLGVTRQEEHRLDAAGCSRQSQGDGDFGPWNCTRVDLRGVNLIGLDLTNAFLTSARLEGVNLSGVQLSGATLTGTDLTAVRLRGSDPHRS